MAKLPFDADADAQTASPAAQILFEDDFDGQDLDRSKWFPYYLPHWSPRRDEARFALADSVLRLRIDRDQPAWCPEFDGGIRVSNLQTGHCSGPLGSAIGQHRFRSDVRVRQVLPDLRLFLPLYCRLEMKARARLNPWNLAALWLIGFEDAPDRSGEITLFEAFGDRIGPSDASINRGIKKIHDPQLFDEIDSGSLPIAVEDWHVYAMEWTPAGVTFFVDGDGVTATTQSPAYPMQLMLNIYDLSGAGGRTEGEDAWFDIDYIRAFAHR